MVVVYKMLMLIKTWRPLVKPKLSAMADEMITMIMANAHEKRCCCFIFCNLCFCLAVGVLVSLRVSGS
jgi:hypothetical protein